MLDRRQCAGSRGKGDPRPVAGPGLPGQGGAQAVGGRGGADVCGGRPVRGARGTVLARPAPGVRGPSSGTLRTNPRPSPAASKSHGFPNSAMRRFFLVAALFAAATAPVAAAEVAREARHLSGFSRIEIAGQADVTLKQGTSEGVTIEAPAQAMQ